MSETDVCVACQEEYDQLDSDLCPTCEAILDGIPDDSLVREARKKQAKA